MNHPTRPLACWGKAKELRLSHYRQISAAREQGALVVTGSGDAFVPLLAGLGDFVHLAGEPWGASIATDNVLSLACLEAAEARGYARDLCAYMRNYWGSMFLNKSPFGGSFPRPDLCFSIHACDTHAKWFQTVGEYFGVPYFSVELPVIRGGCEDDKLDYLTGQLHDAVEWLEKTSGREFDDEKLAAAARNYFRSTSLWGDICLLNRARPAPLDEKTMFSLYAISMLMGHETEAVEFYKELRDEVRDRVERGIAAVANERCRLLHDSQPPWFFLKLFRYLEQYGAVIIGSSYSFTLTGALAVRDNRWTHRPTPEEDGMALDRRESVLTALAGWQLERVRQQGFVLLEERKANLLAMVKDWQVDGVIMHLNRGCQGTAYLQMENRLALAEAGIPVMTYEGNMADRREFSEPQTLDRIDSFMESLDLTKFNLPGVNPAKQAIIN
ncbi:MAG: benzoyl-CoA reductase, bzd-type, subunit O [Chloroflexi bacterium]|nr:benzoyl-CoA reductase, bzd-type, subunit O [Chloroflexota bacterium]